MSQYPQQGGYPPQGYPQQQQYPQQGYPQQPQYPQQQYPQQGYPQQQQYPHQPQQGYPQQQQQYNQYPANSPQQGYPQQQQQPQPQYTHPQTGQPVQQTNTNTKPQSPAANPVKKPKKSAAKATGGCAALCTVFCIFCCCCCCVIIIVAIVLGVALAKRAADCLNRPYGTTDTMTKTVTWADMTTIQVLTDRTDVTFVQNETLTNSVYVTLERRSATKTGFEDMVLKVDNPDANTLRIYADSTAISTVNTECVKGTMVVHLPFSQTQANVVFEKSDLVEIKGDNTFKAKKISLDAQLANVDLKNVEVSVGMDMSSNVGRQLLSNVKCVAPCTDGMKFDQTTGYIEADNLDSVTSIKTTTQAGYQTLSSITTKDITASSAGGNLKFGGSWTGAAKMSTKAGNIEITYKGYKGAFAITSPDPLKQLSGTFTIESTDANGKKSGYCNGGADKATQTLTVETTTGDVSMATAA